MGYAEMKREEMKKTLEMEEAHWKPTNKREKTFIEDSIWVELAAWVMAVSVLGAIAFLIVAIVHAL